MIWKNINYLLPILLIYSLAIFCRSSTYEKRLIADESKFYHYAINITKGFYYQADNPLIKEGPGYPLILAATAYFEWPYYVSRSLNVLFLTIASLYLFLILSRYLDLKPAIGLTYAYTLYPPILRWANLMYAESLALLLLVGFCFHFISWFEEESRRSKHFVAASFYLGFLALVKIIFAYVIIAVLGSILLLILWPKVRSEFQLRKTILVFVGALAILTPYVIYNYYHTGKVFYLGTHGGLILYHRSSPYPNEFGNSFSEEKILRGVGPRNRSDVNVNISTLRENHLALFQDMEGLTWMQKDSVLKAEARKNISEYPFKYFNNTVANISRILFHFPFSYRIQNLETLGYLLPNMFIIVLAVLGIYPAYRGRSRIPRALFVLILFCITYFLGHALLGGRGRFFIPCVPILIIFFSFVYFRILRIEIGG